MFITDLIIVFSYLFVCTFATSWGPVTWTYSSEIFPVSILTVALNRSRAIDYALVPDPLVSPTTTTDACSCQGCCPLDLGQLDLELRPRLRCSSHA